MFNWLLFRFLHIGESNRSILTTVHLLLLGRSLFLFFYLFFHYFFLFFTVDYSEIFIFMMFLSHSHLRTFLFVCIEWSLLSLCSLRMERVEGMSGSRVSSRLRSKEGFRIVSLSKLRSFWFIRRVFFYLNENWRLLKFDIRVLFWLVIIVCSMIRGWEIETTFCILWLAIYSWRSLE